jgi:tRNA (guanine-N7-)-methyltransferase
MAESVAELLPAPPAAAASDPSSPPSFLVTPSSWTACLDLTRIFDSQRPVEVDLGCGDGDFLVARAKACPDHNFLGVDRMLRRLRKADRKLRRADITNARLVRIEASYAVRRLLAPLSILCFYIFFPDPWPKRRHHRRRLFTPSFLDAVYAALAPGGWLHVATDHLDYFAEIGKLLQADARFRQAPAFVPAAHEQTSFERTFLAQDLPIGRLSAQKTDSTLCP